MIAFLLHNADQEHDADNADDIQSRASDVKRQQGADARGGKGGDDSDRVGKTFVEHAEHDIDCRDRREDQIELARQGSLKRAERALIGSCERLRQSNVLLRFANLVDSVAKRGARREIERNRHRGKLPEMLKF